MAQIGFYRLSYYSSHEQDIRALIRCYVNGQMTAYITFHDDGSTMPADLYGPNGVVHLSFALSRFGDVIATLRSEQPYLSVDQGYPVDAPTGTGYGIHSGPEDIGDLEVVP